MISINSNESLFKCEYCNVEFLSRNKLFKHLKVCTTNNDRIEELVENNNNNNNLNTLLLNEISKYVDVMIIVSGGRVRGRTLKSMECYSFKRNKWEIITSMKYHRGSHGMVSNNNELYVIGGGGLESNISNCEKFNTKNNEWESIASTPSCRHALSVVKTNNTIYAIGGWIDGIQCSNACERYDINTNLWTICESMKFPRRLLGVCYHKKDNCLYTFGGSINDGEWFSNIAECYNIESNIWIRKKDCSISGAASCISIDDYIYVFIHGKSVFRYDPVIDEYLFQCNLPLTDWNCFTVTSLANLIFLSGGATKETYQSFWCYHTDLNQWMEMPSMLKQRRRAASSLVIE